MTPVSLLDAAPNAALLSEDELHALAVLHSTNYETAVERTGWSKGKLYRLAMRAGARKTEARIRERAAERKKRQAETLQAIINSTVTADVLDFMDGIPDESVQLVLTSPPYNLGKSYGDAPSADMMRPLYYFGWIQQVISEAARITKKGGVVAFQVGKTIDWQSSLIPLDTLLFESFRMAGLTFQSRVAWLIPHGLTPSSRLAERYETVLIFSKGEKPVFNPNAARSPQKNPAKRAYKGPNKGQLSGNPFGAWPTDVWADIPTIRHNHPEKTDHPAQFPEGVARRAILLYSMPGDIVCDPFSGSGSVEAQSRRTGRGFVGADLFYEDTRKERLAKVEPDLCSILPGITDDSMAVWQAEARAVRVEADPAYTEDMEQINLLDELEKLAGAA